MKKKSLQLMEAREDLSLKMSELIELVQKSESGLMTDEQKSTYEGYKQELTDLNDQIKEAQDLEASKEAIASYKMPLSPATHAKGGGEKKAKQAAINNYSFIKAIGSLMNGKLEGVEKEMHEEALKEANVNGVEIQGVAVPAFFKGKGAKSMNVSTDPNQGNQMVSTDLSDEIIGALRPKLVADSFGVRRLDGLVGNLRVSKVTNYQTFEWEGEFDDNAKKQPATTDINLSPKRLGGYAEFGKQWMRQISFSAEQFVRQELTRGYSQAMDLAFLNGAGAGNIPLGVLNLTNSDTVAIGANGGAPLWEHLVALESAIANQNATQNSVGFITTPGVRGKLKTTKLDAGSGLFVWDRQSGSTPLNGYPVAVTTNCPNNLSKGSGSDLHAIIFGDFSQVLVGGWGGLDIVIDGVTQALKSKVRVVVNGWQDIAFRHEEAFAVIKDASVA